MNRRGFLRAVGAAGLVVVLRGPAVAAELSANAAAHSKPAEPTATEMLLLRALRERREVRFGYQGFSRRVEPHALGVASEGRLALLAWQSAGGSQSEPPPGWRTFFVAEMENVKLRRTRFLRRANYDPAKTRLKPVIAEVAP